MNFYFFLIFYFEINGFNNKGNTFKPNISSNILIINSNFLDVDSNFYGGCIFINFCVFITCISNKFFFNFFANSSGGGFYIKGKSVFIDNCCLIKCSTKLRIGYDWGIAGCIEIINTCNISFSTINYCQLKSEYAGHVLFSIRYGKQNMNNLNSTHNYGKGHSGLLFGDFIYSISLFNYFYNITGYECLFFRVSTNYGLCEKNNFISNLVSMGAIMVQQFNLIIKDSYFYSNLNQFKVLSSGSISLFGCITDKNNFDSYYTDLNCKINQLNFSPFIFKLFKFNFNIISKPNKNIYNIFLNFNFLLILI